MQIAGHYARLGQCGDIILIRISIFSIKVNNPRVQVKSLLSHRNPLVLDGNSLRGYVLFTSIPCLRVNSGGALKKSLKLMAVVASLTLITGVALAPASQAAKIKLCLALDTGGVDDRSFNAGAWAGAQGSRVSNAEYRPASSTADFVPNIKTFVDKGCDLIVGVGFAISGAIVESAKANPKIKYAVVDDEALDHGADGSVWPGDPSPKNVKGITFKTDEAAFMAGYLAAGVSKSKKVATYGGVGYPTVTIFMDGFARGVAYWNKNKKKQVSVLGYDLSKPEAATMNGDFADLNKALAISKAFEQQGADVILPVGGILGSPYAAESEKSGKSRTIWVDSDGYYTLPAGKSILLTTVVKEIGASIKAVAADVASKKFTNKAYVGTLKNKGISIAPYHDQAENIKGRLKSEILKIKNQIIKGTLDISTIK
jgi:basic membrane protein A and related proteins